MSRTCLSNNNDINNNYYYVGISLGFKTINWLRISLSRLLNRLVGQVKFYVSRAIKKEYMTDNESTSSLVYSTETELKSNKVRLDLFIFIPSLWHYCQFHNFLIGIIIGFWFNYMHGSLTKLRCSVPSKKNNFML